MPKYIKKTKKKPETNFDLTRDSLLENFKLFQLSLEFIFVNLLPKLSPNNKS